MGGGAQGDELKAEWGSMKVKVSLQRTLGVRLRLGLLNEACIACKRAETGFGVVRLETHGRERG